MDFKHILSSWYNLNKRELPWRSTTNPYHILLSEVILQQTRVAQGLPYYIRFISTFPTIYDLANAQEDKVLKLWQGLGYYSRARNLLTTAKLIVTQHNGQIPSSVNELLKLKGIGSYSAGAIASFAFKQPVPAIDGNVYRIIARIFGVFASPATAAGKKEFNDIVMELMDKDYPDSFNQALLDFGALQCVPVNPNCNACPFTDYCYAYRNNMINSLPVKAKRIRPRIRFFTYLLFRYREFTFITKRKANDIWHSLYEFPLIETEYELAPELIGKHPEWKRIVGKTKTSITYISPKIKHQLSHQTLYSRFVTIYIKEIPDSLAGYTMIQASTLEEYSTPQLINNFLAAEPAVKYFLDKPE